MAVLQGKRKRNEIRGKKSHRLNLHFYHCSKTYCGPTVCAKGQCFQNGWTLESDFHHSTEDAHQKNFISTVIGAKMPNGRLGVPCMTCKVCQPRINISGAIDQAKGYTAQCWACWCRIDKELAYLLSFCSIPAGEHQQRCQEFCK